jgi:RNA polymerase sigma-70 factor (ECF subfamily)
MEVEGDPDTDTTLLLRVKQEPRNQAAWVEFVARYGRLIRRWCRAWGLRDAEADDLAQDVLLELVRQMRDFAYDRRGSFRGWLRVVAFRCWCKSVRDRLREDRSRDAGRLLALGSAEAGAQFLRVLDREANRELLKLAIARVRARVLPRTWEAFRLSAMEDRPGSDVARQLGMNEGTVFVARGKVRRMLREEFEKLDSGGLAPGEDRV